MQMDSSRVLLPQSNDLSSSVSTQSDAFQIASEAESGSEPPPAGMCGNLETDEVSPNSSILSNRYACKNDWFSVNLPDLISGV